MASKSQSTTDLVDLVRETIREGTALEGSRGNELIADFLSENCHPDFVTVMVSQDGIPTEHPGIEGFREAMDDWISPYERFRLEIDEVLPAGDKVAFLVRQVGTTKHDGVEIETPSASVWSLLDGKVREATFYLDPEAALEAAGIDRAQRRQE